MHLVVDGYEVNPKKLKDAQLVHGFLNDYPSRIGMTKLIEPQVSKYLGPVAEDWGISGFVLIAESHISIHTFPERGYINVDVFSCKDFDAEAAMRDVEDFFSLPRVKWWTMERGTDYSSTAQARMAVERERGQLAPSRGFSDD